MIDYEDLILQRQEEIEFSEDCNGDCDNCPHRKKVPSSYFWQEPHYECALEFWEG